VITPLESRLRESGIACRVELRERLAILVPDRAAPTRDERLRAIQLARAEGLTHVCVELEPHGAALPRD
jgi:hypothetical protein